MTDAEKHRLLLNGLPRISFDSALKFRRTWNMFTYVFKALDDTVNFTVGTRRLIVSLLPQMIPEDKAMAWLAAAETINVNSEDCMSNIKKELARIGNVNLSAEQAAIDYEERKQLPGESVSSYYAELKALKDERGGITDATFAKDFVRKLRRSLAMAVFRKNTNDPVNDDNPTVVRARAIEEEDLQRLGQPEASCYVSENPVNAFKVNALQTVTDRLERMNTNDGQRGIQCRQCRQYGHIRKFCPTLYKGGVPPNRGPPNRGSYRNNYKGRSNNRFHQTNNGNRQCCYSCGQAGHFQRECPWIPGDQPGNRGGTFQRSAGPSRNARF